MSENASSTDQREENQELVHATRNGNEIRLQIAETGDVALTPDEYEQVLNEIRRTKWILADEEQLESEETVMSIGGDHVGKGECHECGYEGYIVENQIGTTYCPKCRSTNVGWPVR